MPVRTLPAAWAERHPAASRIITTPGSSDGNRLFKIDTFGNILENNAGNRRLDGGIIVGIAFEYRRLIIGAEAQVGLVKINQQLRQVIDTEEFHNYLPRNFASFFTVGYKFR